MTASTEGADTVSDPKPFSLGAVLSVTDGRLACDMGDLYSIMNHITGDNLTTIGLMVTAEPCKAELLRQHPQLEGVGMPAEVAKAGASAIHAWLAGAALLYGETLPVEPMGAGSHRPRTLGDDISEISARGGRAMVVALPDSMPDGS